MLCIFFYGFWCYLGIIEIILECLFLGEKLVIIFSLEDLILI